MASRRSGLQLRTHRLGPLPLVNHFLKRRGLESVLDEFVPTRDRRTHLPHAKALGLLHKQDCKDSALIRQGIPDYLVTVRHPGQNLEPIARERGFERFIGSTPPPEFSKSDEPALNKYSHYVWQRYASPVWMDINPTKVLRSAKGERDESKRDKLLQQARGLFDTAAKRYQTRFRLHLATEG